MRSGELLVIADDGWKLLILSGKPDSCMLRKNSDTPVEIWLNKLPGDICIPNGMPILDVTSVNSNSFTQYFSQLKCLPSADPTGYTFGCGRLSEIEAYIAIWLTQGAVLGRWQDGKIIWDFENN